MSKLARRATGHFVTLIEIRVHIIFHFRVAACLSFKASAGAQPLTCKWVAHSYAIQTHFPDNSWAPRLISKPRQTATRKWPIICILSPRNALHRVDSAIHWITQSGFASAYPLNSDLSIVWTTEAWTYLVSHVPFPPRFWPVSRVCFVSWLSYLIVSPSVVIGQSYSLYVQWLGSRRNFSSSVEKYFNIRREISSRQAAM